MKQISLSLLICLCFLALAPTAKAGPKICPFSWGFNDGTALRFRPYINDPQHPLNSQWDRKGWRPEDWTGQRSSGLSLIDGFYRADILRDQYEDGGVPVLLVGPGFYNLGGEDKRRLAMTIDRVYGVTREHPNGMFMLYDWRTRDPIGSYTKYGLQLQ